LTVIEHNYLEIYKYEKWSNKNIPNFKVGDQFLPHELRLRQSLTTPPQLLTEAELINLMDKNGIGTDATIHEHIKKI